jgi:hypothetical protein
MKENTQLEILLGLTIGFIVWLTAIMILLIVNR